MCRQGACTEYLLEVAHSVVVLRITLAELRSPWYYGHSEAQTLGLINPKAWVSHFVHLTVIFILGT